MEIVIFSAAMLIMGIFIGLIVGLATEVQHRD